MGCFFKKKPTSEETSEVQVMNVLSKKNKQEQII